MYYRDIASDYAPEGGMNMNMIILLLILAVGGYFVYTRWIAPSHGLAYYQSPDYADDNYPAYYV